jgi:hypothetical protein
VLEQPFGLLVDGALEERLQVAVAGVVVKDGEGGDVLPPGDDGGVEGGDFDVVEGSLSNSMLMAVPAWDMILSAMVIALPPVDGWSCAISLDGGAFSCRPGGVGRGRHEVIGLSIRILEVIIRTGRL